MDPRKAIRSGYSPKGLSHERVAARRSVGQCDRDPAGSTPPRAGTVSLSCFPGVAQLSPGHRRGSDAARFLDAGHGAITLEVLASPAPRTGIGSAPSIRRGAVRRDWLMPWPMAVPARFAVSGWSPTGGVRTNGAGRYS